MKLSGKTLKRLVKGAVYFEISKGYLFCSRYSKKQIDYMAREEYDWGWRWRATFSGGIRLEFITDSENISFDYLASDMHERSNTVDLYVDGVLKSVYKIGDRLKGKIQYSLPSGEKKITIYYPCECLFKIKNFTLDGGYKSVKDKGKRVLVIGDSITQGAGPEISSSAYLHALQRKTGYTILGQGVGGYRYEAPDLMKVDGFEPDKIIVFLGTNYYEKDCLERCGYDYEKGVKDFYKRLNELYPSAPVLAVTPLWRNNGVNMQRLIWCIDKIKSVCSQYENVRVADGFELVPNVDECFSDGVHPNSYGSTLLCENLYRFIKEIKF